MKMIMSDHKSKNKETHNKMFYNLLQSQRAEKAQLAIFVIIAIILVASVALVFVFFNQDFGFLRQAENPVKDIEHCLENDLEEIVNEISIHGGRYDPEEGYILYEKQRINYLCYTDDYDEKCVSREPVLSGRVKKEIIDQISGKVDACFASLGRRLQDYEEEATELDVEIIPNKLILKINKKIYFTENEQNKNLENFNIGIRSPMFGFISLATEMVNQELSCDCPKTSCNADILRLAMRNREFEIDRFVTGRNEEIYTIEEALSGKRFRFAVRNCIRDV